MATLLGNKVKQAMDLNDEVIADNLLNSAAAGANAYLNAIVTSATPELRAMYSSSLSQILTGHSSLTELALNRDWGDPYDSPNQQLAASFSKSQQVVDTTEK